MNSATLTDLTPDLYGLASARYPCQRRRDLAQQHLDDHRELALLSCTQFDARSLGLEQTWLEILGSVRHSLVAPFLIRTPESLEAHRPRCGGSKEHPGENAAQR